MELYTVKKGKYYFQGDRWQPALLQYSLILICSILAIIFKNWWLIAAIPIIFFCFFAFLENKIKMESRRVFFLPTCKYQLSTNYDQVNKLFGFAEGFHHWNSARIGWRCTDGENIELLAYCYINGLRVIKPLIKCKTENWIFCNIQSKGSKYVFKALDPQHNSITVSVDKDKKLTIYSFFKLFIYKLLPYFGGSISAPHDMGLYLINLHLD